MDDLMDAEQLKKVKELMNINPAAAAEMIHKYIENKKNTELNIGITGETGSGKSSFVNAFRGLSNKDNLAAPSGCKETTKEPTKYSHPNYPNVVLWDLPGVGAPNFPADNYLKRVGLEKFDFFIIISDTRFREHDVKLALEIQRMGKKFYFVRSKIDNDLRAEERSQTDFNAETTLREIREDCIQGLQKQGFESPQVFLLSNFELHLYDFSLLHETVEKELPSHKKHVLLFAMPNISQEIINNKKKAFQSNIKWYAAASAAVAAVPAPGLSVAVDLGLMVIVVKQYVDGFGLNETSLQSLATKTGVSLGDLRAVLQSVLAAKEITKELLLNLLVKSGIAVVEIAAEEGSRFIPVLGIPVAMALSFTTTYKALNYFLDTLADEAQRVFRRALGLNTSV